MIDCSTATGLRLPTPKPSPVNTQIKIRCCWVFIVSFFFPVWVKQKPQQMFCIHCVFHSQLLQSVVSKRECFLMGLLCLFFLSNITLCLLMVLVSLSRIVSTFMTAVWDTTTAETGCKCTAWRSGEIYCGMVELPLS